MNGETVTVCARDLMDGEEFIVSDVSWDGETLRFRTLVQSTKREGLNEFRLLEGGQVVAQLPLYLGWYLSA